VPKGIRDGPSRTCYLAAFLFVISLVVLVLAVVAVVHNYRFAPDSKVKGQLKYIASVRGILGVGGVLGPLFGVLLVDTLHMDAIFGYLYFGSSWSSPGDLGYALLAHDLLDVSFILRRTLKYGIVTVVMGRSSSGPSSSLGSSYPAFSVRSRRSGGPCDPNQRNGLPALRSRVQDWVDRRFDRVRYDAKRTLSTCRRSWPPWDGGRWWRRWTGLFRDLEGRPEPAVSLRGRSGRGPGVRPPVPESAPATAEAFKKVEEGSAGEPVDRQAIPSGAGTASTRCWRWARSFPKSGSAPRTWTS